LADLFEKCRVINDVINEQCIEFLKVACSNSPFSRGLALVLARLQIFKPLGQIIKKRRQLSKKLLMWKLRKRSGKLRKNSGKLRWKQHGNKGGSARVQ
jgi:hypothetical protein